VVAAATSVGENGLVAIKIIVIFGFHSFIHLFLRGVR